jgi:FkbM family methyltransferase
LPGATGMKKIVVFIMVGLFGAIMCFGAGVKYRFKVKEIQSRILVMLSQNAEDKSLYADSSNKYFDGYIKRKDQEYRTIPLLQAKSEINRKRLDDQDLLFKEFKECPDCLVKKVRGNSRSFMFDAVFDCDTMLRVGINNDGGKWLCNPQSLPPKPVVYSFGVGDDISFDTDMAGYLGGEVFMFDPARSVGKRFSKIQTAYLCGRGQVTFMPIGLGPVSAEKNHEWDLVIEGEKCEVKSLRDIARSLDHDHIDILKIDIEGGEFAALDQILKSKTLLELNVKQLLVEFHIMNDSAFKQFVILVETLRQNGYVLFRKEFNPNDSDGRCAEYAFVKENFATGR